MSKKSYLFTSESVSEGHPDKVCDRISDSVVDAFLAADPESRVAVETLCTTNRVVLAGEVRGITQAGLRVREAAQLGFQRCVLPRANIDPADRVLADRPA